MIKNLDLPRHRLVVGRMEVSQVLRYADTVDAPGCQAKSHGLSKECRIDTGDLPRVGYFTTAAMHYHVIFVLSRGRIKLPLCLLDAYGVP